MLRLVLLAVFFIFPHFLYAQKMWEGFEHLMKAPGNYVIYQTASEMIVDGNADEVSWQKAEWSEAFKDIEGDIKPEPIYNTRMKMLWDNEYLYILAELEEPHIWTYYANQDQIVYHENDFEIFIDPNCNGHDYFEFEVNAQNTLLDLFMPKPYRNGGHAKIDWNMRGFKSAISIDGTLNNPADVDKMWRVEVAIPFQYLTEYEKYIVPEDGSYWKINFSRVQWQTEVVGGKYVKVIDKNTNKPFGENNWVWSPQGVVNMHYPERWGLAQFSSSKVGSRTVEFKLQEAEKFSKYLWFVYYKQQNYKRVNGNYAVTLSELGLHQLTKTEEGESFFYKMEVKGHIFTINLQNKEGLKLSVNQDGLFQVLKK